MSWSHALRPCALAAMVAILLVGLGLYPVVAILAAGVLAVAFYHRRSAGTVIKAAIGARLGALTGLLCFAMSAILETLIVVVFHKGAELQKGMLQVIQQQASRTGDPQVLAIFAYLKTPPGLRMMMFSAVVFGFFASIILAALGGAVAGAFLGRRDRS